MKFIATVSLGALLLLPWFAFDPSGDVQAPTKAMSALKVGEEVVLVSEGPGRTKRGQAAIALGKGNYLIVWQEGWHGKGGSSRIYALQVGLDGKPLDPKGVEIAPCKTGVQENPRVAYFRGNFLVVWQDMRNGKDCDVFGARVSLEGKVLDEKPIPIAVGVRSQVMPDVAADDKGFMVVWHGYQGEELFPQVFAMRIGADGVKGLPVVVTGGADPRLAWSGREYLLAYSTFTGDKCAQVRAWLRMDTTGKPNPHAGTWFVYGESRYSTCAMPEGKGWLIVEHESSPDLWNRGVGIQRIIDITPEGALAPDSPTARTKEFIEGNTSANFLDTSVNHPKLWPYGGSALVPDGKYCVVVWQRYRVGAVTMSNGDIRAGRADGWKPMDGDGGVAVAESDACERDPALAGDGTGQMLCVYEKIEEGKSKIAARTIESR
jgi:hypothetical protein